MSARGELARQETIFRNVCGQDWEGVVNGVSSGNQDKHGGELCETKPEVAENPITKDCLRNH